MNINDLLGAMVQSGMSPSSNQRMKNSLGGGNVLDNLTGMLGKSAGQSGGGLADILSGALGGGKTGQGGGIADVLSGVLGQGSGKSSGGGIADVLTGMLGEAGKAVGGNKNLAVGSLGALVGALLGGGKKSAGGAMGGGLMALLGALAFNALKASGQKKLQIPAGLLEPETAADKKNLEQSSELVLRAMINAAKADGQVDQNELNRIMGKLNEAGVDEEGQNYVKNQLQQPMETKQLISEAKGKPELAAQLYAASLLAIEVDTQAEKDYLNQLATGLGLASQVTGHIQQLVGLQSF
ncbi:MAG: tellurite resistance TerB family protein [Syntrophaceae bacterium]|nr:tellurite resistance TerB family protein [Syntrophaceae bacterium]